MEYPSKKELIEKERIFDQRKKKEYPSKKELIEKERIFDQEVDNQPSKTTKGLSDKHQIAAIAFKTSVHVLPRPFDAMAESIYEIVDDYDKEKLSGHSRIFRIRN